MKGFVTIILALLASSGGSAAVGVRTVTIT